MPHITRDGVKIYYEAHGSGTPLLLSHGFTANSAMWARQAALWSKQFKVIVWDMRGHGQSDYPEDAAQYSEAHCSADMAAILDATCGVGSRAVVGGLSLGGHESLGFYKRHPERVLGLLIMDSSAGLDAADTAAIEAQNTRLYAYADLLEEHGLAILAGMAVTPEKAAATKHRDAKGLARAARGMLAQHGPAMKHILPNIRVPTLLIVGANDEPFLGPMEHMAKTIPGAEHVVVADAGHAVNFDAPEEVERICAPFLQKFSSTKANL